MTDQKKSPCEGCTRKLCKDKNCLDWWDWFAARWRAVCRPFRERYRYDD